MNRQQSMQTIPDKLQLPDTRTATRPKYNWNVKNVYEPLQIIREAGTFALMFTNLGDSIANVNGKVLYPGTVGAIQGDSFSIGIDMQNFEFSGIINVAFSGGSGVQNNLEVVTLFYV